VKYLVAGGLLGEDKLEADKRKQKVFFLGGEVYQVSL
jgi:hypothetical protein